LLRLLLGLSLTLALLTELLLLSLSLSITLLGLRRACILLLLFCLRFLLLRLPLFASFTTVALGTGVNRKSDDQRSANK
jgi:hypothetical protein